MQIIKIRLSLPTDHLRLHNGKESVAFVSFSNIFCGYLSTKNEKNEQRS